MRSEDMTIKEGFAEGVVYTCNLNALSASPLARLSITANGPERCNEVALMKQENIDHQPQEAEPGVACIGAD